MRFQTNYSFVLPHAFCHMRAIRSNVFLLWVSSAVCNGRHIELHMAGAR